MIAFPNCKINLGLHVINKRADGYHNLETIFYPLPLHDVLEVIQNKDQEADVQLFLSGIRLDADPGSNLCVRAYRLLKKSFPQLPAVKIYLYKTIPVGAGLGGGSADAAFTLLLLDKIFKLHLGIEELIRYALELGSDCPFFILNTPCFATQRGERLYPLDLNLSAYKLVVINPGIHIDTAWAFSQVRPSHSNEDIKNIIAQPIESWRHHLKNDFEIPVFSAHPEISAIKNILYNNGAIYAAMSGSGSTVYGVFQQQSVIKDSLFPGGYFIKELSL